MISFPNAKINLGLHVVERRSDGFHNITTVYYPVALADVLEILPSRNFLFRSSGLKIAAPSEENLVTKAYRLLQKQYGLPHAKIHLHKVIPSGAGLGGGSSDAAHTLKMVNSVYGLNLKEGELERVSSSLGADCPFFIRNRPSLGTGKGDILVPVDIDLSPFKTVIVKPPVSVSTAAAYGGITPQRPTHPLSEVIRQPVDLWKSILINDFEKTVFRIYPEIARIKDRLYELGAVYASMSGSGSAVYGIFRVLPPPGELEFPGATCYL